MKIDEIQPLVGQTFEVHLGENKIPLTLDAVEPGTALEGEEIPESVNRNPFALLFSGALDQRLPDHTYSVTAPTLGDIELYLDCCNELNPIADKLIYESHIA